MLATPGVRNPRGPLGLLLGLTFLTCALPSAAQERAAVGVVGGLTQYDLGGVGTTPLVSFRAVSSLSRSVLLEGAVSYFSYFSQGQDRVWHILPDIQVQWQWMRPGIRPYLGTGLGMSHGSSEQASTTDLTASVAGGLRLPVTDAWMLVGELRVHSIDPWTGPTADWGIGILGRL